MNKWVGGWMMDRGRNKSLSKEQKFFPGIYHLVSF